MVNEMAGRLKKKRRILFVGPYPPHQTGGHEYVTAKTAKAMKDRGFDVFVLFMGKEKFFERYDDNGIKVYRIDKFYFDRRWRFSMFQIFRYFTFELFNPFIFLMTMYVILRHRIDVVHFSSFHQISMSPLIAAKLLYRKVIVTMHSHELFCFISSLNTVCPGSEKHKCGECILNDQKIPGFLKGNRFLYKVAAGLANQMIKSMLFIRLKAVRLADVVTFPSEYLEKYHIEHGINPAKSVLIYNFLYNPEVKESVTREFEEKWGLKGKGIIMFAGHMINLKGPDVLLKAFANLLKNKKWAKRKNLRLLMIGRGPLLPALKRKAARLGIKDRTVFTGWVPRIELMSAYSLSDVVVIPSRFAETFSMIFLEAFSMKKAVIASDIGALSYNIKDGETGFLVKPADANQLTEKLDYVLSNLNSLGPMRRRAYEVSQEKYSSNVILKEYERLFS
jgi:glycosyltransferase involved in cell wall biosynthesis